MIGAIRRSRTFGITILREDQEHLGIRFAGAHLTAAERFKGTSYEIINGCPLLRDGLAEMSCVLEHEVSLSENTVFFGRVNYIEAHPGKPLVYFHRQWRHLTKNKQEEDSKAQ